MLASWWARKPHADTLGALQGPAPAYTHKCEYRARLHSHSNATPNANETKP